MIGWCRKGVVHKPGAMAAWLLAIALTVLVVRRVVFAPDVEVIARIGSPDGRWMALVEAEEWGSSFGPIYLVVVVQRNGCFRSLLWKKKVVEVAANAPARMLDVQWNGSTELSIVLPKSTGEVRIMEKRFDAISIEYVRR